MTISAFGVDHPGAIAKRDFSAGQRKKLTAKGDAIDGKLPIKDAHDLANAERLAGKVKGVPPKRVHAYLNKEKKKFGKSWSDQARQASARTREQGQRAKAYTQQTGPFDSEKQRHRRADVQSGAAAGGAVVTAGGARRQARVAGAARKDAKTLRARSEATHATVQDNLHRMGQPTASPGGLSSRAENATRTARLHREATGVGEAAQKASRVAGLASHKSRASAAASAGLGAAAYAIHRHDDKPGRSYGYR